MSVARLRTLLTAGSAVLIISALTASAAKAQSATAKTATEDGAATESSAVLPRIVVTGGGDGASTSPAVAAKQGTAMATTTTAQEITDRFVDSWQDFSARAEPGVNFSSQTNSINVRGLDQGNVLTTIDGIRIPYLGEGGARTGSTGGLSTFDFGSLSTIDVVRGADSSIAGSGAMGGIVALTTLSAEDILRDGRNFGFLTKNTYLSANQSFVTSNAVAGRIKDTSVLVQGSYTNGHETETMGTVGGYGTARTEANPMDFDQYSVLGKLTQRFDGGHELTLTAETFKYDSTTDVMTSQSLTGNYRPGNYDGSEVTERQRVSLTYDYKPEESGGFLDGGQTIAYWQNLEQDNGTDAYRSTSVIGPYIRDNSNEIEEYGLKGWGNKKFDLGGYQNSLTFGGELYLTNTTQYSYGVDNCPANPAPRSTCSQLHTNQADSPDADGTTLAAWIRDDVAVTDRLTLTPGLRYDWFQQVPQASEGYLRNNAYNGLPAESSGSKLSPSLLGTWQATKDVSLYAQWAQSFTAPTPAQLYLTYGGAGAYVALGNPDLKPQEGSGYEAGVKFGDGSLGGGVSLFSNFYKNFIDAKSLTAAEAAEAGYPLADYPYGVTRYVNLESVNINGVEARANWQFAENWKTWGSVAWMVGQDLAGGTWLDSVPPVKGIVGIGYFTEDWGTDLLVTAAALDAQTSAAYHAPAYAVADWTVWWQPKQVEGLRLQAGVFNLFDEKYWNALDVPTTVTASSSNLDYYTEPGRNYRVNLTYQF